MFIVIGDDGKQTPAVAGLTGLSLGSFLGQQPGDRRPIAGNDNFLARLKRFDQLRQTGLGFFESDGGHGTTPDAGLQ
jgi:hypothetical protein